MDIWEVRYHCRRPFVAVTLYSGTELRATGAKVIKRGRSVFLRKTDDREFFRNRAEAKAAARTILKAARMRVQEDLRLINEALTDGIVYSEEPSEPLKISRPPKV